MTKQSGLGDAFFADGYDLSGDIMALGNLNGGISVLNHTDITQEAFDRAGGVRDAAMELAVFFNDATDRAHARLSTLPRTNVEVMYCRGTAAGKRAAALTGKQVNYDPTRSQDGGLSLGVQIQNSLYGLDWARLLTAGKVTVVGGGALASVDFGADQPGNYDAQAYLHVFSFTGTDATVAIQTSTDDAAADPFDDRITFDQITTAPHAQRKTMTSPGSQLMERYARVNVTTTGGFSELIFAVAVHPNTSETSF